MTEILVALVVAALVGYVWVVQPIRWFHRRRKSRLPDVWIS